MSDLISRDDAIAYIQSIYCKNCNSYNGIRCRACNIDDAVSELKDVPAVDAEPVRHGRWIAQDDTFTRFMCSECKAKNYDGSDNYCPNCGARMDEEDNE